MFLNINEVTVKLITITQVQSNKYSQFVALDKNVCTGNCWKNLEKCLLVTETFDRKFANDK
jgi:hypothetical protein